MMPNEVRLAAQRIIEVVQCTRGSNPHLIYVLSEINLDLETLTLADLSDILSAIVTELCDPGYSDELTQRVLSVPFAKPAAK
jgi:hypothetical protein